MKDPAWRKMIGIIVEVSYYSRRAVETDDGTYLISLYESEEVDLIPTGTRVTFMGGNPGERRAVARLVTVKE